MKNIFLRHLLMLSLLENGTAVKQQINNIGEAMERNIVGKE